MNAYCKSALHQIQIAINSIIAIMHELNSDDLQSRPTDMKYSIGELLQHISLLPKADYKISNGATEEEMSAFYSEHSFHTIKEIEGALINHYQFLEKRYLTYTDRELQEKMVSYWGATYSRYEWLLQIVAHLYHHRGQLHAMLVHCCRKDPQISLFE
ncbi:DinB family protein [Alkalihalophilus lindianensis]|uniref:DinB family protein n=1 Tax=Alkalihalophilus lindianensis TaxID=1630542 RepID=A0ABU3XDK6_9BACI|nr:DinB family protein [Alkalihalophilus lindianensis]MDV2685976.1 DinB family protein [Alkalihalophilus lindianensis]